MDVQHKLSFILDSATYKVIHMLTMVLTWNKKYIKGQANPQWHTAQEPSLHTIFDNTDTSVLNKYIHKDMIMRSINMGKYFQYSGYALFLKYTQHYKVACCCCFLFFNTQGKMETWNLSLGSCCMELPPPCSTGKLYMTSHTQRCHGTWWWLVLQHPDTHTLLLRQAGVRQ